MNDHQESQSDADRFARLVAGLNDLPSLRGRVFHVLTSLPPDVQQDFLDDPKFSIYVDNFRPGQGSTVFMAVPGPTGDSSRSVVLKPLLAECSAEFAHYVIAHEFAHAFLRNGPWGEISDVEEAADRLAESWGFVRPVETPWGRFPRFARK